MISEAPVGPTNRPKSPATKLPNKGRITIQRYIFMLVVISHSSSFVLWVIYFSRLPLQANIFYILSVLVELCRRKTIAKIWNYDLQGGVITL